MFFGISLVGCFFYSLFVAFSLALVHGVGFNINSKMCQRRLNKEWECVAPMKLANVSFFSKQFHRFLAIITDELWHYTFFYQYPINTSIIQLIWMFDVALAPWIVSMTVFWMFIHTTLALYSYTDLNAHIIICLVLYFFFAFGDTFVTTRRPQKTNEIRRNWWLQADLGISM